MMRNTIFILMLNCWFEMTAQQTTTTQQVSTFTIDAPQLHTQKKIWLYLPKNYTTSNKKYPVVYMHDAQNLFDAKTSYAGEWNIDESLDSLNAQVIVVGIEHGNEKRMDELTPYRNEKYGGGKADGYLDFIITTLKPHIDKKYRTKKKSKHTAIMGSSIGALFSFYAVLKYPKVFGKAGLFSPSFWFAPAIYDLATKSKKNKTKIYFLAGDIESDDMVSDLERMEKIACEKSIDCKRLTKKVIIKDGKHNEKLWRQSFVNAYLWMF